MMVTMGVDWAEAHHDVAIHDPQGRSLRTGRIDTGPAGFSQLLEMIADCGATPETTAVAVETDKNLLVVALQDAGFEVFAINPRAVARYRERTGQAGAKSDARDAAILADILRTDRHLHRPMPHPSDQAQAVKALARQHQEAIWALHQTLSRLRSVLLEFYPGAVATFPQLKHHTALAVLAAAPTPTQGRQLTRRQVVAILHQVGRRNDAGLADQIRAGLQSPALVQPQQVADALGVSVAALVAVAQTMIIGIDALEAQLAIVFATHPWAPVLRSAPGLGPVLAARVLAEIGDDPARFATTANLRSFAGTAPVTRASGKARWVQARRVRNKRLADACHWWAFAALTRSAGARAHYDRRRAAGDHHNAALRHLANTLLSKIWHCLQHQQAWNEHHAWPTPANPPAVAA
jgi:transposase